ncbi:hypothetical protein A1C_05750 [Rickettsia akari str. Hartford]|uniref:Uncharacterized protein n=1 Tax=Rickettsia akari (strain Hartford) TaxID=293614 RepID=A8GPR0_RICAH|nr:hypothetical protein [Rickettsia akari]ABV75385.1 hypothetical protein A1C_05750 [Rickettsia akari str. Hartford]
MDKITNNSIDLIVTSTQYNLKSSTGNGMKDACGSKWSNAALLNGYKTTPIVCRMINMSVGKENA